MQRLWVYLSLALLSRRADFADYPDNFRLSWRILPKASPRENRRPADYPDNFHLSWRADLNRRPADYESAALPAEIRQQSPAMKLVGTAIRPTQFKKIRPFFQVLCHALTRSLQPGA